MNVEKEIKFYRDLLELEGYESITILNYVSQVKAFLRYFESKKNPADITLEDFEKWLELCKSQNTKNSKITAVRSFYFIMKMEGFDMQKFDKSKRKKSFLQDFKRIEIDIEYEKRISGL